MIFNPNRQFRRPAQPAAPAPAPPPQAAPQAAAPRPQPPPASPQPGFTARPPAPRAPGQIGGGMQPAPPGSIGGSGQPMGGTPPSNPGMVNQMRQGFAQSPGAPPPAPSPTVQPGRQVAPGMAGASPAPGGQPPPQPAAPAAPATLPGPNFSTQPSPVQPNPQYSAMQPPPARAGLPPMQTRSEDVPGGSFRSAVDHANQQRPGGGYDHSSAYSGWSGGAADAGTAPLGPFGSAGSGLDGGAAANSPWGDAVRTGTTATNPNTFLGVNWGEAAKDVGGFFSNLGSNLGIPGLGGGGVPQLYIPPNKAGHLGSGRFANQQTERLEGQGQAVSDTATDIAGVQRGQGERQQELAMGRAGVQDQLGFSREAGANARADEADYLGEKARQSGQAAARGFMDQGRDQDLRFNFLAGRNEQQGATSEAQLGQLGREMLAMGQAPTASGMAQSGVLGEGLQALRGRGDVYSQAQGPSIADATRQLDTDRAFRQAIALGKSGRGMGGGAQAEQAALGEHFGMQSEANMKAAEIAAKEHADWQRRRLEGAALEQQAYQGLGSLYGQQRGQEDAMRGLGMNLGFQGGVAGQQMGLSYDQLAAQQRQAGAGMGLGYNQLGEQARQSGIDDQQGFAGIGQGYYGQGLGFLQGMQGLGNQAMGIGFQGNAAMQGIGNQMQQGGWQQQLGREQLGLGYQEADARTQTAYQQMVADQYRAMLEASEARRRGDQGFIGGVFSTVGDMF